MKFKLDENLPNEAASLLIGAGHDVHTVWQEDLCGQADSKIISVCKDEERILVTLDTDFCNILAYPPRDYPGIIVIRSLDQSKAAILGLLGQMLPALNGSLTGKLWVVQNDGIRVR